MKDPYFDLKWLDILKNRYNPFSKAFHSKLHLIIVVSEFKLKLEELHIWFLYIFRGAFNLAHHLNKMVLFKSKKWKSALFKTNCWWNFQMSLKCLESNKSVDDAKILSCGFLGLLKIFEPYFWFIYYYYFNI